MDGWLLGARLSRFLQSQILWRCYKSPLDETINRSPPVCMDHFTRLLWELVWTPPLNGPPSLLWWRRWTVKFFVTIQELRWFTLICLFPIYLCSIEAVSRLRDRVCKHDPGDGHNSLRLWCLLLVYLHASYVTGWWPTKRASMHVKDPVVCVGVRWIVETSK